jgi:hypothetical protein
LSGAAVPAGCAGTSKINRSGADMSRLNMRAHSTPKIPPANPYSITQRVYKKMYSCGVPRHQAFG